MYITNLTYLLKIVLACLCGGLIGCERHYHNHEAGIKTNMLVCLGACVFTIISITIGGLDIGRISAGIVTGIGFLGAGCIVKEGASIKGLTTASLLWIVSAIGMAIGYGNYFLGITSTIFIVLIMFIIKKIEKR
jgi:putative Mg2+ transporter-C (MgtC) family protein